MNQESKIKQIQEQGEQQRKTMSEQTNQHKKRAEYDDILARRRYDDQIVQKVSF